VWYLPPVSIALFLRRGIGLVALVELASCFPGGPPLSGRRQTDDDAGGQPPITIGPGSADAAVELGTIDPHAVIGVDPSHGPFNGGQARIVRGNGFAKGLRVWFGSSEVPKSDVIPIDPARAQVIVPPGAPGPVDVKAQIGTDASTARILQGAYTYEDFYADPSNGPTSGGTILHLYGQGTSWALGTTVTVDNAPCDAVDVISSTELSCATPRGTAGAKTITVTAPDKVSIVRDGFTTGTAAGFRALGSRPSSRSSSSTSSPASPFEGRTCLRATTRQPECRNSPMLRASSCSTTRCSDRSGASPLPRSATSRPLSSTFPSTR
jgi:hypothetical protein